ncbi:NAD(P)H-dependent oxidoreductase [Croceicoccus sp. F390]|uniref:NAD(P)H-dependent oxidoreductase n=1 Tax=Croceicoccus esteveae TaxID=3075597 RepID=A0ABU2ZE16_9SPHN|nr:NAD(P)H-dependent oxidoreductase [Croceicoccus sp. F390]MDT0574843.1 NAD(P)H-dependent oxidoreductase [Croceicoccus sp. F390]
MKILQIDRSTSYDRSVSRILTGAILDHFTAKGSGAKMERDPGAMPLPHLDRVTTGAIRLLPEDHDAKMACSSDCAVLDQFLQSDVGITGAPMYDFTFSSAVKSCMDRPGEPDLTYRYDEVASHFLPAGAGLSSPLRRVANMNRADHKSIRNVC